MSKTMTVGQWLERTIHDLRNPGRLKPTSNWQVYATLLHRLQREGSIIHQPISKVNDKAFRSLIKWIKKSKESNFNGTLKTFTALINRAHRVRLTRYVADFPYRDYAPRKKNADNARVFLEGGGSIKSMDESQWQAFLSFDLNKITGNRYWKQVYYDFCVLLYELKSRPIDVLRLHSDNFAVDPITKRIVCSYIPAKKINQNALVVQYLSPVAEKLVTKYLSKGYLMPFPMNRRKWNLESPAQFEEHYAAARNQLAKINRFLQHIGKLLALPFPLTLYAFRRTAITHAIIENRIPLPILAKIAGTSVRMIEMHYTNYFHALANY